MKIRSVTYFFDPGWPLRRDRFDDASRLLEAARNAFPPAGYPVETTRVALGSFSHLIPEPNEENCAELSRRVEAECFVRAIDYASLGPALPDSSASYDFLPTLLASAENIFASAVIAEKPRGVSVRACQAAARAILHVSQLGGDGFANLRLAALACVPPFSPFFPAAYHDGGPPGFAIATEAADLAVEAISSSQNLVEARARLVEMIEQHAGALTRTASRVASATGVRYLGVDFSLAPFPEEARSLGTALERLGVPAAGLAGTVTAAAILAAALDQAEVQSIGFRGLLLPPLEDAVLARRAAEGLLTVSDLMIYSSLCGTGLDTIPLPGDVRPEQLAAQLLDLGALALRHDKPLTARLMPLPGKRSGDEVAFDFEYFAPSRVMTLKSEGLTGLLAREDWIEIPALHSSRPTEKPRES
ncbi:MAG: DUF711 family protein [Anaerolineales bacterium]|jgi:uncharacterized protein (UPF0210 family)